jgi:SAM-dependent methyltransferase
VCGAAWLMDELTPEQLAAAYSFYYTHREPTKWLGRDLLRILLAKLSVGSPQQRLEVRHKPTGLRLPLVGRALEDTLLNLGCVTPQLTGSILDVGCGNGERLDLFREAGWGSSVGADPDPAAVETGLKAGRDLRIGTAESLPFPDCEFDAVSMHHVIEHVTSVERAIVEAKRVIKAGGVLSILTPNINCVNRTSWGRYWRGFEAPRHQILFSQRAIRTELQKHGFLVELSRTSFRSFLWTQRVSERAQRESENGAAVRRPALLGKLSDHLSADAAFRDHQRGLTSGDDGVDDSGDEIVMIARKR